MLPLRFLCFTLATAALLGFAADGSAATDITACGHVLANGEKGILQADLDCTGGARVCIPPAEPVPCTDNDTCNCGEPLIVQIGSGGKLDMNGHTVANGDIICTGPGTCRVDGGGTLNDAHVLAARNADLRDLAFAGPGPELRSAIVADGKLSMKGVDVVGTTGVVASGKARFTDVVVADTLEVAPYMAVFAEDGFVGKNVSITGDAAGAQLNSPGQRTVLIDSTISVSGFMVARGNLILVNTSIGHVLSTRKPMLKRGATCASSQRVDVNGFILDGNWGVCTLD